ncbi:DNA-directed RNA polymerase specialized sigma24 family protein [Kitasatospora sp. MAA19]|uniref:sigma factor-like helix-turn-helix DNA-binding protein n=1 Tax=Kitasatospora sp. MAA19 TaxID=3035090 RepID=UPI002475ED9F|nr:sigma factor-like helix-turn-helix DNA-binding protein [Kitasatospora sp. MAA19]MDH6709918.1 DNA-directed RNA polymerase specialized sigma24 family protein [Kitasatospora sp. MAA19]
MPPTRQGGRPRQPTRPARVGPWALRDLHYDRYLQYATLLLPAADACNAIREAFDELADSWPRVLAAPSPAACAWQTVRHRVRTLAGPLKPVAHLSDPQQDVLVLHLVLDLPETEVAELTGTDPAAVHMHLCSVRAAHRHQL